jgi:hypothetical protein
MLLDLSAGISYRKTHIKDAVWAIRPRLQRVVQDTDGEILLASENRSIDYLFFVHDRHDGNLAAARAYLEWETNLLQQLDQQEQSIFHLPA